MNQKSSLQKQQFSLNQLIDLDKSDFAHLKIFQSINKHYPWQVLTQINDYFQHIFPAKNYFKNQAKTIGSVHIDKQRVSIDEGTQIQHGAMIKSHCIIGKNCQIRKGAYLRGNVIIGDNVVIGNSCQIKNSIILNNCEIPHFNYVGDSVLGTKVHLSAGAITSNFRLDGKNVNVSFGSGKSINSKLLKFGAIIGDNSQIGCNVVLNPGSLIGKDCWIYPNVSFRGFLKSNSILKLKQETEVCIKRQIDNKRQIDDKKQKFKQEQKQKQEQNKGQDKQIQTQKQEQKQKLNEQIQTPNSNNEQKKQ